MCAPRALGFVTSRAFMLYRGDNRIGDHSTRTSASLVSAQVLANHKPKMLNVVFCGGRWLHLTRRVKPHGRDHSSLHGDQRHARMAIQKAVNQAGRERYRCSHGWCCRSVRTVRREPVQRRLPQAVRSTNTALACQVQPSSSIYYAYRSRSCSLVACSRFDTTPRSLYISA